MYYMVDQQLFNAVKDRDVEAAKAAIHAGADVNAGNQEGEHHSIGRPSVVAIPRLPGY